MNLIPDYISNPSALAGISIKVLSTTSLQKFSNSNQILAIEQLSKNLFAVAYKPFVTSTSTITITPPIKPDDIACITSYPYPCNPNPNESKTIPYKFNKFYNQKVCSTKPSN